MGATIGTEDKPHPQSPAWCRTNAVGAVSDNAFAESLGSFFERLKLLGNLVSQADELGGDDACTLGMWLADMAKEGDAYSQQWWQDTQAPSLRSVGGGTDE